MKKLIFLFAVLAFAFPAFAAGGQDVTNKALATAGTAYSLSATSVNFEAATVCADTGNSGKVAVGNNEVVATSGSQKGVILSAGNCITINNRGNLKDWYATGSANTQNDSVLYIEV